MTRYAVRRWPALAASFGTAAPTGTRRQPTAVDDLIDTHQGRPAVTFAHGRHPGAESTR